MPELRCRVPERLADFTPLLGVGLRHLVALGGLGVVIDKEPVKQVRIRYSMEDQVILDQLMTEFEAKQPSVIIAALECASRCRLEPIQESARPKAAA